MLPVRAMASIESSTFHSIRLATESIWTSPANWPTRTWPTWMAVVTVNGSPPAAPPHRRVLHRHRRVGGAPRGVLHRLEAEDRAHRGRAQLVDAPAEGGELV